MPVGTSECNYALVHLYTWVYLGSLGLIMVDVGDLGCRVLNLENESTYKQRIPRMSRDPIGSNNQIFGSPTAMYRTGNERVYTEVELGVKNEDHTIIVFCASYKLLKDRNILLLFSFSESSSSGNKQCKYM